MSDPTLPELVSLPVFYGRLAGNPQAPDGAMLMWVAVLSPGTSADRPWRSRLKGGAPPELFDSVEFCADRVVDDKHERIRWYGVVVASTEEEVVLRKCETWREALGLTETLFDDPNALVFQLHRLQMGSMKLAGRKQGAIRQLDGEYYASELMRADLRASREPEADSKTAEPATPKLDNEKEPPMAIRLRTVDGVRVALCAEETDAEPEDVYLDDADHYALAAKFARDWHGERIEWTYDKEWAAMETQKKRDAEEEHERWSQAQP